MSVIDKVLENLDGITVETSTTIVLSPNKKTTEFKSCYVLILVGHYTGQYSRPASG